MKVNDCSWEPAAAHHRLYASVMGCKHQWAESGNDHISLVREVAGYFYPRWCSWFPGSQSACSGFWNQSVEGLVDQQRLGTIQKSMCVQGTSQLGLRASQTCGFWKWMSYETHMARWVTFPSAVLMQGAVHIATLQQQGSRAPQFSSLFQSPPHNPVSTPQPRFFESQ